MKDQTIEQISESKLAIIGNIIHSLRMEKNEKLTTVASSIGVSHSVISKIEHGRYKALTVTLLYKIANHFNVSIDTLLPDNDCS